MVTFSVHPHDPLRLEVVIPGERHLYLRAPSNSERQEWLVALGSMKQEELSSKFIIAACFNWEVAKSIVV